MGKVRKQSNPTNAVPTDILTACWFNPPSVKGDIPRAYAAEFAAAASLGLITTRTGRENFGHRWLITAKGIETIRSRHGRVL